MKDTNDNTPKLFLTEANALDMFKDAIGITTISEADKKAALEKFKQLVSAKLV